MLLNKKAIKEFKTIYIQKFHKDIDDKTAQEMAKRLLLLFKVVYKSPTNKQSTKHD